ncbi:MAG: hypothetical protein KIT84_13725 [Labilithrix sp.]|nr:hypothetical protein [Labilithrix sp.]MCW5812078.1 hypothetical protein [Labilithrix sp.]
MGAETERERELKALRTQVANQAASLAETVNDGFDGYQLGAAAYAVELAVPEGQSTDGGKNARQNIRLVPRRRGYPPVVAGTVDPVTSTAEVRTFEHVAILHEVRFGKALEINAEEYADFLYKLDVVLNLARIRPVRFPPPPDLLTAAARRTRKTPAWLYALFAAVLVGAAVVVYLVLHTI